MKLLFEEALQTCFKPPEDRINKLKAWIDAAKFARDTDNLEASSNQHDRAEELITFYAFAPLVLSLNRVGLTNHILGLAGISPFEENVVSVGLERQYNPPVGYLHWLENEVKNHPIRYVKKKSADHVKKDRPLESCTHVDAFIETDKLLIFFEIKYTSDIAHSTTYNPYRNKLARLIDVGLEAAKFNGKEVLVLLSTPSTLYERRSRFYFYKVQDYSDPLMIQRDLGWRTVSEIKDNLIAVKWVALEELISLLYKDFNHPDKKEAIEFFKEKNLV